MDIEKALKKIWPLTGFASLKELLTFIRLNHEILFHYALKGFAFQNFNGIKILFQIFKGAKLLYRMDKI